MALRGIAALDPEETLYLNTFSDIDGRPLDASSARYRIPHPGRWRAGARLLVADDVRGAARWSPVPGRQPDPPLSAGDRTRGLAANPDGSLDLLVQADPPADATNWLPAPRGRFRFSLRAYLPDAELVAGRRELPRVERLDP